MTDDEELFTAEEAAREAGLSESAIYVWTHRGHLKPAGKVGKFNQYRLSDVFTAEKSRQRKYRRKAADMGAQ
ncbi:hypothetical protein Aph01nite_59380 [Acrocarpospora phusangensis]|uniref:Helix-turn-helix domain-containing protein n=1 Tax=Acrocarpospora phusangensis TaxID=1070424 RepID=A0A919QHE7_9ACTN|nr:helix-turn-helix domain-containing protein [Acrocarpospora phusangensis]GIH27628.1 hypothetical protein Aph01nite_59380 [Acrocarpospora phusangensis]